MTVCGSIVGRCIVRPVKALWHRRPVRHVIFGLLPLLVVGPVVIILLAVHFADESAPVRAASSEATATVARTQLGEDKRGLVLTWTDANGTRHTSTVGSVQRTSPGRWSCDGRCAGTSAVPSACSPTTS